MKTPPNAGADLRTDRIERWCGEPNITRTWRLPSGAPKPLVVLNATATGVRFNTDRSEAIGVEVASDSGPAVIPVRALVFACGGLETTRLLLNVRRKHPHLFGGEDGPLGRHYMAHASGHIAQIVFSSPEAARNFAFHDDGSCGYRRRVVFSDAVLRSGEIPNIAFYPDNPKMSDPAHESGILSALFLLISVPVIGRRLLSPAIREMQMSGAPQRLHHLRNIFADLAGTASSLVDVLRQRLILGRRKPFVFIYSRNGEYPLHYHSEHAANADSRVSLGEQVDSAGLFRLKIDLRFSREDGEGVVRAHDLLDRALRASGLGRLDYSPDGGNLADQVLDQARDGFHQIGLTRMGRDEQDGVVNADCRVFGVRNLYLAGSSVFRTSGQANPTFFATAMAMRLADHISAQFGSGRASP